MIFSFTPSVDAPLSVKDIPGTVLVYSVAIWLELYVIGGTLVLISSTVPVILVSEVGMLLL